MRWGDFSQHLKDPSDEFYRRIPITTKDGLGNEQEKRFFWLFQNSPVFKQDVVSGDFFRYAFWHTDIPTTENKDFIGIKNSIAVLVKDKQEFRR